MKKLELNKIFGILNFISLDASNDIKNCQSFSKEELKTKIDFYFNECKKYRKYIHDIDIREQIINIDKSLSKLENELYKKERS